MRLTSCMFALVAILILPATLFGDPNLPIPNTSGTTHLDLNPVNQYDTIPAYSGLPAMPNPVVGSPSGIFRTGEWVHFEDSLVSGPWHWETELYNPNVSTMSFTAGWYWPGGSTAYNITLPVGNSFGLDIVLNEIPETSSCWSWGCKSTLGQSIGVDTSVVETTLGTSGVYLNGIEADPIDYTGNEDFICKLQSICLPVSFSVDGGQNNVERLSAGTANPAEGINLAHSIQNDVFVLGPAAATGANPGSHGLATEGEIFVSTPCHCPCPLDPDHCPTQTMGTNVDFISGALGNTPRVGPHNPPPAASPAGGVGVLGMIPNDNMIGLSYGKDAGDVLFFSVDPASVGVAGTDVDFEANHSPYTGAATGPFPQNPGGGDVNNPNGDGLGNEAAGDIYASQRFARFGSRYGITPPSAPIVASANSNRLLYDECCLGLQAPAVNGSALGGPEDDLDALELAHPQNHQRPDPICQSDPSGPAKLWGADFNGNGELDHPTDDPIWFTMDQYSPSVGLATKLAGGNIPLFTPSPDASVSPDDILVTHPTPSRYGYREDLNDNGQIDACEDINCNGTLDPYIFGIYADGVTDIGLLVGDVIDALILDDVCTSEHPELGWLDPGEDAALFSLAPGSPTLINNNLSAADIFITNFMGNWGIYATHAQLGLEFDDNVNALDTLGVPEPGTLLLIVIGGLILIAQRSYRRV